MICADTNVFIDFFRGTQGKTIEILKRTLDENQLLMNPFVLSELLSSPRLPKKTEKYLLDLPRLELMPGFFERAGLLRRRVYQAGRGIPIADVFIAQACIDARIPLLTVDRDFLEIAENSELRIAG